MYACTRPSPHAREWRRQRQRRECRREFLGRCARNSVAVLCCVRRSFSRVQASKNTNVALKPLSFTHTKWPPSVVRVILRCSRYAGAVLSDVKGASANVSIRLRFVSRALRVECGERWAWSVLLRATQAVFDKRKPVERQSYCVTSATSVALPSRAPVQVCVPWLWDKRSKNGSRTKAQESILCSRGKLWTLCLCAQNRSCGAGHKQNEEQKDDTEPTDTERSD
jgi:hypothetical protein